MKIPLIWCIIAILKHVHLSSCKMPNVLFIVSDDMRPQLGAYEGIDFPSFVHPKMYTPNLDRLASRSLLLKRAYVQQACCSPSRTSFLTGRRPDTTHVTNLIHYFREVGGNFTTLPQYFKQNGYRTMGMGKIFHPGKPSGNNDPLSWTDQYYAPKEFKWGKDSWKAVPDKLLIDRPLIDQLIARNAIKTLNKVAVDAKSGKQPFFMAVGFRRPHLPFVFPESFLQHYPMNDINLPNNPYAPVKMPPIAWSNYAELLLYSDIQYKYGYGEINSTGLPNQKVLDLRRAYYASISYVDSLIGQVINELEKLDLGQDTIISFLGDHGWQLGEHGEWCKQTNFELATHAPLVIHIPGLTNEGMEAEEFVEFVDIYPTLAEAAGLPLVPTCPKDSSQIQVCTEGVSFMPLIHGTTKRWKKAAFSQYPRMDITGNTIMGYSIRTSRFRYTEWVSYSSFPNFKPMWNALNSGNSIELYDHRRDPEENMNQAFNDDYEHIRKDLSNQLHDGWRAALPST